MGNMIFMIGIGHIKKDEWKYKVFCSNRLTNSDEEMMMNNF